MKPRSLLSLRRDEGAQRNTANRFREEVDDQDGRNTQISIGLLAARFSRDRSPIRRMFH